MSPTSRSEVCLLARPRWVYIPHGEHDPFPNSATDTPRGPVCRYDPETQLLHPSRAEFKDKRPTALATLVLRIFSALGLVQLEFDERSGEVARTTNLTILNVFLLRLGPMREDSLTKVLIATQVSSRLLLLFGVRPIPGTPHGRGREGLACVDGIGTGSLMAWVTPFCIRRFAGAWWRSSFGMVWLGSCTMVTGGRPRVRCEY